MTKLFLRVQKEFGQLPVLYGSDRATNERLNKLKDGDVITAIARKPRHPKHHAKLFAMLNLVWESTVVQDRYPKVENLLDALKLAMGHTEPVMLPDGTVAQKIKSIAFESMDQSAFEEFYDQAVEIIATRLVPHLDREELKREVERMIQ